MIEEQTLAYSGGVLHLSRVLSPEQMNVLIALPVPHAERASVIEAHIAIARQFMPRARKLAARAGVAWPAEFEQATHAYLQRSFGGEFDISW